MADDYPKLAPGVVDSLKVISTRVRSQPDYLDGVGCPYPDNDKRWLKKIFLTEEVKPLSVITADDVLNDLKSPEQWLDIAAKARTLYNELETLQLSADVGEKVQIIKAKAGLLERLNIAGEKALGFKAEAEFIKIVMGIMDDVLDPDQRIAVMAKLEPYI